MSGKTMRMMAGKEANGAMMPPPQEDADTLLGRLLHARRGARRALARLADIRCRVGGDADECEKNPCDGEVAECLLGIAADLDRLVLGVVNEANLVGSMLGVPGDDAEEP